MVIVFVVLNSLSPSMPLNRPYPPERVNVSLALTSRVAEAGAHSSLDLREGQLVSRWKVKQESQCTDGT